MFRSSSSCKLITDEITPYLVIDFEPLALSEAEDFFAYAEKTFELLEYKYDGELLLIDKDLAAFLKFEGVRVYAIFIFDQPLDSIGGINMTLDEVVSCAERISATASNCNIRLTYQRFSLKVSEQSTQ